MPIDLLRQVSQPCPAKNHSLNHPIKSLDLLSGSVRCSIFPVSSRKTWCIPFWAYLCPVWSRDDLGCFNGDVPRSFLDRELCQQVERCNFRHCTIRVHFVLLSFLGGFFRVCSDYWGLLPVLTDPWICVRPVASVRTCSTKSSYHYRSLPAAYPISSIFVIYLNITRTLVRLIGPVAREFISHLIAIDSFLRGF